MGRKLTALVVLQQVFQNHGDVPAHYVISGRERKQSLADDMSGVTELLGRVLVRSLEDLRKAHGLSGPISEVSQNWLPDGDHVSTHVSCRCRDC
jgi:hypothetical protein